MPRAKQPSVSTNRTDLLSPSAPGRAMEAPDQAQGRQTAQAQSQRILPVGTPPVATPATPQPAAAGAPPPPQTPPPGSLPWLHPSNRPNEPITHGLATGPGGGPDVLQGVGAAAVAQQSEGGSLKTLLSSIASRPGASSAVKQLLTEAT